MYLMKIMFTNNLNNLLIKLTLKIFIIWNI